MAAFSSILQQLPFLLDSNSDPSTTTTIHCNNICSLSDEPNHANYFIPYLDHKHNPTNNDSSSSSSELLTVTNNKNTADASSVRTIHAKYDQNLLTTPMDNKRKSQHPSASNSPNSAQSKDKREVKGKKQKKMKIKDNMDEEKNKSSSKEEEGKNKAAAGYIHVRARRGQATDSHSLAERVRRERISERMKLLQGLVPGCDKVTGKALMLDEIINYVQSLQNQVEFLSMKLASVNPMFCDFGVDLEMESFVVRPHDDQDLSNLAAVLPSIQESSPTTTNNHHPIPIHLLENSAHRSVRFPQPQIPNVLPRLQQGSRGELDEHRQRIMNQSGFTNTFFSFH